MGLQNNVNVIVMNDNSALIFQYKQTEQYICTHLFGNGIAKVLWVGTNKLNNNFLHLISIKI